MNKKMFIENYGCQMNVSDSEVVTSILHKEGYKNTDDIKNADLILLNTCSIREKAELTIKKRLKNLYRYKKNNPKVKIGILGCMAERMKKKLVEEEDIVDLIVGPDAYRNIPSLLKIKDRSQAIDVKLSRNETYSEIFPMKIGNNNISSFVTITRGCDNMCTFCIVPFTRGRERSRDPKSIIEECSKLVESGCREITLLGQNVDSYIWYGGGAKKDFDKSSYIRKVTSINFSSLLDMIAKHFPDTRIRFTTSNPQDMKESVIQTMSKYNNICKHIHLPFQSGSNNVLKRMNRQHTREQYINLINNIKKILPDCALSHDIITGFCDETEQDHQDTLSLMEYVKFDFGFMFMYSERPGTIAHRKFKDNVPNHIKKRRLQEIIKLQNLHSYHRMHSYLNNTCEVLIDGLSKKDVNFFKGRNSQNCTIVFPKKANFKIGDLVKVKINKFTSATLIGEII